MFLFNLFNFYFSLHFHLLNLLHLPFAIVCFTNEISITKSSHFWDLIQLIPELTFYMEKRAHNYAYSYIIFWFGTWMCWIALNWILLIWFGFGIDWVFCLIFLLVVGFFRFQFVSFVGSWSFDLDLFWSSVYWFFWDLDVLNFFELNLSIWVGFRIGWVSVLFIFWWEEG